VTQIPQQTIETTVQTESGWPEFAAWLSSKRVTLSALVLIAAQVGLYSYVLTRGYFQEDDFAIGGLAAHSFTTHLLFQNYAGHLMPGVFALAWVLTHTGGGYDWGLWAGALVAFQALAGLALLRALRTLAGNRMLILIPLGVFLFTPMALTDLSWWSVGIQSVPLQLGLALAVDQHVRYVRTGRIRNAVFATLWILFGLAFFEKSVAIPVLLFALTSAYLVPGSWPTAMLATLRKHWLAWVLYAATIIAEFIIYLVSLHASPVKVHVPQAGSTATFSWDLLRNTFLPAAVGGPWRWTVAPGAPRAWSLYSLAAPPLALVSLAVLAAVVVVVASLWYRRLAWKAWVILLGWLLIVDALPIALGRLATFGSLESTQIMYVADSAPVLAICLTIGFLPLQGEEHPYRTAPLRGPLRYALLLVTAVAFGIGSVWSASTYRSSLQPLNTRSYLATASAALGSAPPDAVIYPTQIPTQMAWTLFGQLTDVSNVLAPMVDQVSGQAFQWSSMPSGKVSHFMVFDSLGRLHPADVIGPHTLGTRRPSDCILTARGMRRPLTASVYALPLLMQIGYYSVQPVTLAVTFGGKQYQMTLPASPQVTNAYLPVQGPDDQVTIMPVTPDPNVCIGTVTVGNVEESPLGAAIPIFPLHG
jgi:hypothetical protein